MRKSRYYESPQITPGNPRFPTSGHIAPKLLKGAGYSKDSQLNCIKSPQNPEFTINLKHANNQKLCENNM
jgi:hypothetical protein